MRINFSGQFRDVIRVVQGPVGEPESRGQSFSKVLSDLNPNSSQPTKKTEEIRNSSSVIGSELSSSMARYDFHEPMIVPPSIGDLATPPTIPSDVKITPPDVKPPTAVQARRVSAQVSKEEGSPKAFLAMHGLIENAGHKLGIDPALTLAVAQAESSFNPQAVSGDGHQSKGLFQLLDTTGMDLHQKLDIRGRYDPFDPSMNTDLGVNYLRRLHDIFSQDTSLANNQTTVPAANSSSLEKLAVAAFNAGEGRVAMAQERARKAGKDASEYSAVEEYLPDTTQDYVKKVFSLREQFADKISS